ncbi:hypothetical protein LXA43DRAFT_1092510 [Ganoderma leucocontextum]|nr:hypothetical protein LXA43DRAFT_1092510 [Ganoderma leucocontextum]
MAVETWSKRPYEAAQQARSFEADVTEANWRREAERVEFDQQTKQATRQVSEAEDRAKHLEVAVAQLAQELRQAKDELRKTEVLLDTRSAELRDAQAYLTRLDDVADAEVLQLIDGINSRIFQVAASIADTFQSRYGEGKDMQVAQEAAARLQGLVSSDLLPTLSFVDHAPDPLVVQTVLQAAMASYTRSLCDTWSFCVGNPSCFVQNVYHLMRQTEQQSVAGRWRALCLTYMKKFRADDRERRRVARDELLEHVTDILLASGIAVSRQDLRRTVERIHADVLREVIHLSYKFQCITVERIISRDLLIYTVIPGEPFDPSCMVDEWADPKRTRRRVDIYPVLCTTQLGVVRGERMATEEAGGEGGISSIVLLKPKVVLTSFLDELWDETSS